MKHSIDRIRDPRLASDPLEEWNAECRRHERREKILCFVVVGVMLSIVATVFAGGCNPAVGSTPLEQQTVSPHADWHTHLIDFVTEIGAASLGIAALGGLVWKVYMHIRRKKS